MTELNEQTFEKKGYRLHIIQSKKFKTVHFTAKLRAPLSRDTMTKRALLPFVMQRGTKRYPTTNEFRRALDNLYGATFSMDGGKKGEEHVLTARMTLANQAYLSTDENILKEGLSFFSETLFKPKQENDAFDPKIVAREKQTLKQRIASIIDDKMQYANMRMLDEMCKDEPYSLHVHGYSEDLDSIDEKNLYQYYDEVFSKSPIDLYILGDFAGVDVESVVGTLFDRHGVEAREEAVHVTNRHVDESKEIIEEQQIQQAKLHLGYRTHTTFSDPDYPALQVFNAIFGGFPSSKLFINVREKNSLAYYASSQFESHKGLLFVFSGIAPTDFDKAKAIILEQMEAMKNGDFTEKQIAEAKRLIINQYKQTLDDPFGLTEVMYNQQIAQANRTTEELFSLINQVDADDITKVANKLELDTVYYLTTTEGGAN